MRVRAHPCTTVNPVTVCVNVCVHVYVIQKLSLILFQPNKLRCNGRFYLSEQSYSSVKMLIRKDAEIAQFGHVIPSGHGDVTGWKRHQKLVAEIQLGNFSS